MSYATTDVKAREPGALLREVQLLSETVDRLSQTIAGLPPAIDSIDDALDPIDGGPVPTVAQEAGCQQGGLVPTPHPTGIAGDIARCTDLLIGLGARVDKYRNALFETRERIRRIA